MQPEDSHEAQRKFANAKSISSAQYFGDQNKNSDAENSGRLQKFAVSSSYAVDPTLCVMDPTYVELNGLS